MKTISRKASVITGLESNMEHLFTLKDFPVFFGCTDQPIDRDLRCDMVWEIDKDTGIVQLTELVPLEILYKEQHVDAFGKTWDEYNHAFSDYVINNKLNNIIEIGGGSGKIAKIIIDKLQDDTGYLAIEPNPLFEESEKLKVIKSFFSKDLKDVVPPKYDTVIFSQVYEHAYDPKGFLEEINQFLEIGGRLVFAYPNLEHWIKEKFTNSINFEHTLLMTDYYVDFFLKSTGFKILEKVEYKKHSHFYVAEKVEKKSLGETKIENKYEHYKRLFLEFVGYHIEMVKDINKQIEKIGNDGKFFLFGGHIFSQYLIMFGLNTDRISYILDNSLLKQDKRLYGTNLEVKSPKILKDVENPVVILKAGLYDQEIKEDILNNINENTKFI